MVPGSAGIAELAIFHPVDTIAKRLMSNQGKVASVSRLNEVIFKDKAHATAGRKFTSLFPGLGYAAGYKVHQVHTLDKARAYLDHRYYNEYINMVVSHLRGIS